MRGINFKPLLLLTGILLFTFSFGLAQEDKSSAVLKIYRLTDKGGRVAWYKGDTHELIAYDAVVDPVTQNTEVFIMNPDGTDKKCVTCGSPIPKGFIGQPEWHPDGEHIIVQAENANSQHTRYNHMAWGINQDLWIIKKDGRGAELIYASALNHASLHAHFNEDGTKIIFSERIPTGKLLFRLTQRRLTPGGENPWDGWCIHIADFDINREGIDKLYNHRSLFGNTGGFYETHGFTRDDRILFSHTAGGRAFVDDVYIANLDGTGVHNLTRSPLTWEEHGLFSPSEKSFTFISSRFDSSWRSTYSKVDTLRTELYLKNKSGIIQLTAVNKNGSPNKRYLVSDYDWDEEGKRIALQIVSVDKKTGKPDSPEIWMIEFRE